MGSTVLQRLMNQILRECQDIVGAYINDIVVYSNSWEDHLGHLERVLQCLEDAGLRVKWKKCNFACSKVHYLGHVIGQGQIEPDEKKVIAVRDYPKPMMKRQVQWRLRLAVWLWNVLAFPLKILMA